MIIAIDGPSGAGKSSVSVAVAERLGFSCLDTGAMYRSIAWFAVQEGVPFDDSERLGMIAATKPIDFIHEEGNPKPVGVTIDGVEVTREIRTAEIDRAVSPVSAVPSVRDSLVDQQRRIGHAGNYVVEGRDIGTVVFPDAFLKVYLTASDEVRAERRVAQNHERGVGSTDFETVLADIKRRDEYDSSREESPLKPADDALVIDTSEMSFVQVVDKVCALAQEKMN